MRKVDKVSKFVEGVFDLYDINKFEFFFSFDEESLEEIEIPLFPNGEIDEETLNRVSIALGLTKEEILEMDRSAAYRYWNKYPFFELFNEYLHEWDLNWRYKEKPTAEEFILKTIFEEEQHLRAKERYDYKAVKERLVLRMQFLLSNPAWKFRGKNL